MDPVKIAVRMTYVLKHWSLDDWPVEPLGNSCRESPSKIACDCHVIDFVA